MAALSRLSGLAFLVCLRRLLPAVGLLLIPISILAQESDLLTGRVVGQDGQPLAGERVEAMSVEKEITR